MAVAKSVAPTVLIFEDEEVLREMMGIILCGEGVKFRSYSNPIIELALPHDCNASDAPCKGVSGIISDVNMPGIDGLTFYEQLVQSDCHLKNSMLVLMSAMDQRKALHNSPCEQFVLYLDKPFVVKELRKILNEHLAH